MFSRSTSFTAWNTSAGDRRGFSWTSEMMLVCVIIITSPDSTPCPDTSPIAIQSRSSPAWMMS